MLYVLIALAVIVVIFVAIVALQPPTFRVERATTIQAPAPVVFARVNDFHNWQAWSPWAKLDPMARNTFEGAPSGTGAIFSWSGNKKIGEGRMTMTNCRPHDVIKIHLEFIKPFKNTSTAEFNFNPAGDQTTVTWSMTGRQNFMAKAFCLFINMDKMLGGEFEKGLTQLKAVSEANLK